MKGLWQKDIPELQGLDRKERRELLKRAWQASRWLRLNLRIFQSALIGLSFPASIFLTEFVVGERTLLGSLPLYVVMVTIISFVNTRYIYNPELARTLARLPRE